jgi:glycosyltransferase involved in cell wall biosynthesis
MPTRKAILIFGHSYATQFIDINNQYTRLFDPAQFAVTVVYLTGLPNDEIKKQHLAQDILFLNASKRTTRGLKIAVIRKMLLLQRQKKFQIIICHRYKPSYIMLWVARFSAIPAVFFVMHELKTMHALHRKLLVASLAQKNMFFAGVSNAVRDDIRRAIWRVPPEQIITLYNMIDIELTVPLLLERTTARRKLNLAEDNFVYGTIGRLVKAKDQQTLIKGFALIKAQCPQAKLIIIGDGELEATLKKQVQQLSLANDIIFTGFIPQGFCLLKAFDVFVLTSIKEAFGRVLLEAMLAKIPIIATKVNGIPEVMGNTGSLIDAANPAQLAEKMLAYYQMPPTEIYQWGEKGNQRARKDFSIACFNEIFWQLPLVKKELI